MSKPEVTVEISTKDRYHTTLPLAILSVAQQTYKPSRVLIFDDGEHKDLREDSVYKKLFDLMNAKGIKWEVIFGERKGQTLNHQKAIDMSTTEFIWRVDDDDTPEADVLEILVSNMKDDVGGVGGLILTPGDNMGCGAIACGKIENILSRPNVQWFRFNGTKEVDHFNNSFLFRKSAAGHGYCMDLSPVGHREETLFSYGIKRNDYKLLVDPKAVTWHLRSPTGGIRSYESRFLWDHDEKIFRTKMDELGVKFKETQYVVLNSGIGDHFAFKMMLPELKEKCKREDRELIIAACSPEVFEDDGIPLISIADAQQMNLDVNERNLYWWMIHHNWKGKVVDAYRKMLL